MSSAGWSNAALGDQTKVVGGGFSSARKVWISFTVILPKLLVAAFVLIFGLTYLVYAKNDSELILNCTALCFVLQLDEFMYAFFANPKARRINEACPPFTKGKGEGGARLVLFLQPFAQPIKVLVSVGVGHPANVHQHQAEAP